MDEPAGGDPDLGETKARDPDALPPSNLFELGMSRLYHAFMSLGGGNLLFAFKAGLLTGMSEMKSRYMGFTHTNALRMPVLLSLPYHFKNSASFAYRKSSTARLDSANKHVFSFFLPRAASYMGCVSTPILARKR